MQPVYAVMYRVGSQAILASLIIPFPLRSIDSTQLSSRASSRTCALSATDLTFSSFSALTSTLLVLCVLIMYLGEKLYLVDWPRVLFCPDSSIHRSLLPHDECFLLHFLSDWLHHSCVFMLAILHEAEAVEAKRGLRSRLARNSAPYRPSSRYTLQGSLK